MGPGVEITAGDEMSSERLLTGYLWNRQDIPEHAEAQADLSSGENNVGQKKNGGEEVWGMSRTKEDKEDEREVGNDGQALEERADGWFVLGGSKEG
jgi:hypothetical protein